MSRPLGSTPITGASSLLRDGPPATAATVLNSSRFLPPRFLAADEGLVHLHPAGQAVASGAYQDRPQAVQHGPSGGVGADLQRPLQAQRRDAVLLRSEHSASGEPHRQRRPPPVEQGARGHRGTRPAAGALVPAITDRPPTHRRGRSEGTRSRPASAATPGSPG